MKSSIDTLREKIDLSRSPVAGRAAFDPDEEQDNPLCVQETCVGLLKEIVACVEEPNSTSIF